MAIESLRDWIFPMLDGSRQRREKAEERQWQALAASDEASLSQLRHDAKSNVELLTEHSADLDKLIELEQARRLSVESRLASVLGMMSIAATIVLSGMVTFAWNPALSLPWICTIATAFSCLYVTAQLLAAGLAAVDGLSRSSGSAGTAGDVFADSGTTEAVRLYGRLARKASQLRDERRRGDAKVSQMAVAHIATRNFLFGLLILALIAFVGVLTRDVASGDTRSRPSEASAAPAVSSQSRSAAGATEVTQTATTTEGNWAPSIITIVSGLGLLVLGSVIVLGTKSTSRKVVGSALMTGGAVLSILGGSKLELQFGKIDKLIGELSLHLFERPSVSMAHGGSAPSRMILVRVATVGPFPDANHVLDSDRVAQCLKPLLRPDVLSRISGWQLVGRVDKRPLKPDRAAIYGSNQTLAMSRATWVRDQVLAKVPGLDLSSAIASVGGAGMIGGKLSGADLQADRAVDLYGLFTQVPGEDGKTFPTETKAAVCP